MAKDFGQMPETIERAGTLRWFQRWRALQVALTTAARRRDGAPDAPVALSDLRDGRWLPLTDELDDA
jgi:hypothetical protein